MYLSARIVCDDSGLTDAGYDCFETSFGRVAIKHYPGLYTWDEARLKCSQDGKDVNAELPAPLSKVENDYFVDMARGLGLWQFWLGVNDIEEEEVFRNQHGALHPWFFWRPMEPSFTDEQNCVWSFGTGTEYGWKDDLCTETKKIFCTHILGKAVISIKI